ncbi:MAG: glycosyltransferase family 2 protein [Candidatus Micrarchaeota archaeon]|nr:glycosyltransferase family 2 protein [Candidatus Micrarchaeota archaeon]
MKGRIAIFIPARNEERAIGSVVLLAKKYGRVFVVDDGSEDRTAKIARKAGAEVIRNERGRGYGAALKAAFEKARTLDVDAIVTLDGDFQHNPQEIGLVAAPVLKGEADVALGSRFLGRASGAPAYRLFGVRLINALSAAQAGGSRLDYECGFRAFSRKAIEKIRIASDGYAACGGAIISAQKAGLKVVEVPVHIRYFEERQNPLSHGAGLAGFLVQEMMRRKPLLFFGGGGFALLCISALIGMFVVEVFYSRGVLPVGSAFLTVFTGISGLVMILIGINLYTLELIMRGEGSA